LTVAWEQDFDVYMASLEDKPASFVVDLAADPHAPLASHPLLLSIRVPMLRPREDGLRDAGELEALSLLEDQFVEALTEKVSAIYVGRVVHAGTTTMFLYAPREAGPRLERLPDVTGAPPEGYAPEWSVDEDESWNCYGTFLAPDPFTRQTIWNRRLLRVFEEKGDVLETPRQVDHLALFEDEAHARDAGLALRKAGFATEELDPPNGERPVWALSFHRQDTLADGRPDAFVGEILDIIGPLEGIYDGWGAVHCGRN
jgi:hypothetical protein